MLRAVNVVRVGRVAKSTVNPESPAPSASRDRSSEPAAPCPTPSPLSSRASSPVLTRARRRDGAAVVAGDVFGAADRLAIRDDPDATLSGLDEASDELTVDELGAFAGGTSSTAHPALRHDRRQAFPSSAVDRAGVLRLVASPCEPPAPRRAEALVLRDGNELAPAASALALSEGARHSPSQPGGTTDLAGGAELLIAVRA